MTLSRKDTYRALCEQESTIGIFSQAWWLDLVCGPDNWDVCLVERSGSYVAAMPYRIKRRLGFLISDQPPLTQTLGPWIKPNTAITKTSRLIGYEHDILRDLLAEMPKIDLFSQRWHYSYQNWLAFYWKGYQQTTRYTYILPNLNNIDQLSANLASSTRRQIKKAQSSSGLQIDAESGVDAFLDLNDKTFQRQGILSPYPRSLAIDLINESSKRSCGRIFLARDQKGTPHAGVFTVWDAHATYNLMSGADSKLSGSGAPSLCMWEAILHARQYSKTFDFEGSMIEPIERFFRGFGAIQKPYFSISKKNSRLLQMLIRMRQLVGNSLH